MSDHRIYGGLLRSTVALFEPLPAVEGRPDWTLRVSRRLGPMRSARALGWERVDGEVLVRLFTHEDGLRLCYDDTGDFDISPDGRSVRWCPRGPVDEKAVEADVTGRVLPLALHLQDVLALHGSGVAVGGRALIFVAPKFSGKSTLAFAMTLEGASLLTDDVAAIEPGEVARVLPGMRGVRLWPDTAALLAGRSADGRGKVEIEVAPRDPIGEPLPVEAIYVLRPVTRDAGTAARRERLAGPDAALALVAYARLGALLRGREAGKLLAMASAVARVVPVHVLEIARDLDRLPDVAGRILRWHRQSI